MSDGPSGMRLDNVRLQDYSTQLLKQLLALCHGTPGHLSVGITGVHGGVGVSTLAADLAIAAAGHHLGRVLLIDAHLQRPSLHTLFGTAATPGLADILPVPTADLPTQATSIANLHFLPSGKQLELSGELHGRLDVFPDFLASTSEEFPIVVADLPPVNICSDFPALFHSLDGIVLVVEAKTTSRAAVSWAKQSSEKYGATVLGIVFNKC